MKKMILLIVLIVMCLLMFVCCEEKEELKSKYECVDLGLSVKWATCNVGAENPEDFGNYYAWGELEPKEYYDWDSYKYCNGTSETLTKYCTESSRGNNGFFDAKNRLTLIDDVANTIWGDIWRMPNEKEINELKEKCQWQWITQNGVNGYKVVGPNGNHIFLPASGYISNNNLNNIDFGEYWSSSLSEVSPILACCLKFSSDCVNNGFGKRSDGRSIRPVFGDYQESINQYTISVSSNNNSYGNVSVGDMCKDGSQITITAIPNSGYKFIKWNDDNIDNPRTVVLTQDTNFIAYFEKINQYTISVSSNNNSFGSVLGGGVYKDGSQIIITAIPNSGYKFIKWNDDNTDNPRTVVLTQDTTFIAYFEKFIPQYVDLGLSVKWATCNVGATKPEEYGDYFAWGETERKDIYNWSTYKHCVNYWNNITKYCNDSFFGKNGFIDNKYILDPEDDAAHVNWGGAWRMPTKAEQDELRNNCTWDWTTQNGVKGYKVTGQNGNSIFLPAAGYNKSLSIGLKGCYWSNTLYSAMMDRSYIMYFDLNRVDCNYDIRYFGFTIRPVCP